MQPAGNYHEGYERVRQLSALFLRRLHEIAGEVYAEVLSSGVIRPEEMEEEIQRYFAKKKSGLQDVYSYYGEQWDYYYQVVAASDADFLPMSTGSFRFCPFICSGRIGCVLLYGTVGALSSYG